MNISFDYITLYVSQSVSECNNYSLSRLRQGNVIFLGGLWDLCPGKPEPQDGPINPPFFQISQERPAPPSASQSPISNRQCWSNLVALNRSGGILLSNYH